ncbi:VOC family protein [Sphingobium sp. EM0848]|uniref:VOC family protein n=1 Tax=Sphingobium sp. EM0848 TaxID=2743473 RepID=UPI001C3FABFE|nr:VOC family protein [Sphingobium sp. EM0848]
MMNLHPLPKPTAPEGLVLPTPELAGVHHTARPTWKLEETVHFYREVLGLKLCHAISARGWGPGDHPDFLHFFFESGNHSTIAFFYYLKNERPPEALSWDHWLYRSVHTAWRVEDRETMLLWKERLEAFGYEVMLVTHEVVESIYVTDPNGYMVEIGWQLRPFTDVDTIDAALTLEAAIKFENEHGRRVETIEEIWREKSGLVERLAADGAN